MPGLSMATVAIPENIDLCHLPDFSRHHHSHFQCPPQADTGRQIYQQQNFSRWRPSYHLMAPYGWMNDPCAPGYDPSTKAYHVAFQWNPKGNDWGDIAWGHATSHDMVSWRVSPTPCLTPDTCYDRCGVFTGCYRPTDISGEMNGTLSYLYTSVNQLPIHYTLPYAQGCESLSLATSRDGGKTWEKHLSNPILPTCPADIQVTGWRDPFVAPWPSLSNALGCPSQEYLYGCLSGGIVGKTPTLFLYSISAKDLSQWAYLGPLLDVGLNRHISRWSGDLGVNWEAASFMTLLDDDEESIDVLIMGAEGCKPKSATPGNPRNEQLEAPGRIDRSQTWLAGKLDSCLPGGNLVPQMRPDFGGIVDHGCFYAAATFWDPLDKVRIIWGWITEEDLPDRLRFRQNWSGLLSLPRVIRMQTTRRVLRARSSSLNSITSLLVQPDEHETFTIKTLGSLPDCRLERYRETSHVRCLPQSILSASPVDLFCPYLYLDATTSQWELECEFTVNANCKAIGIIIGHSTDYKARTTLSFYPESETFVVDRHQTNEAETKINTRPEIAPHTLFTSLDPVTGQAIEEKLRIRCWFDTSVLEIFINERTTISTRIYPSSSECSGVRFFAEALETDDHFSVLEKAIIWDGLRRDMITIA